MRRALAAVVVLGGCATVFGPGVAVSRWVEAPPVKGRRVEPALPRRDACLKPPYTLPPGESLTLHGFRIEPRTDGPRELTFTSGPGARFEADALLELMERHRGELAALDGVEQLGLSGCLSGGKPTPCLSLELSLCAQPLDALAGQLEALLKAEPAARGHQVLFHVALEGAVGPRCEADDARCRPEPYGSAQYRPGERRGQLAATNDSEPDCNADGECARSACGAGCTAWTVAHQSGACASEKTASLSDALCGCVEHRCSWFVQ
ncbi:MAG: hypothetical protein IPJ65_31630 [Archangiaceae bacterium]|nr:hypothetical protein [Archangiaceae bacterium]